MAMPTELSPVPVDLLECPVDRAVYRMRVSGDFSAGFARQDPRRAERYDLVFWLKTPKRTYWFSFSEPDFYDGPFISPTIDPGRAARMGDTELEMAAERIVGDPIAFDTFSHEFYAWRVPSLINPAPSYLFARGLGRALWHDPKSLAGGGRAEQEEMPLGIFELVECAAQPH
jgi:hypothetical protein